MSGCNLGNAGVELPSPWAAAADPLLAADEQLLETLETAEYWEKICPHLHVGRSKRLDDGSAQVSCRKNAEGNCQCQRCWSSPPVEKGSGASELRSSADVCWYADTKRSEFVRNGFFHLERADLLGENSEAVATALSLGVVLLMQNGWPASFIFVYDEAWEVMEHVSGRLEKVTGGSKFLGDLFAWYVDPQRGQKGWGAHRDRMGSGPESFRADGTPMLSTTWFALTDAGPLNSCLYVVPREADPNYDQEDRLDVDPLAEIFSGNPCAFQSIRALPARRGSAWHFSHKMIHWGSSAVPAPSIRESSVPPRIAMSWVVGDSMFEEPAFHRELLPFPPIGVRVGFIGAQQIAYGGQTGAKKSFKNMCYRFFKLQAEHFTDFYKDKVSYLHFMRPPPQKVQLKERTKKKNPVDIDSLEFFTPSEDTSQLDGLCQMFDADESSSDEE